MQMVEIGYRNDGRKLARWEKVIKTSQLDTLEL